MEIIETKTEIGEKKISIYDVFKNKDLIEKTGIKFVYETNLSSLDIATKACNKILNLSSREIELCVLVTQTPDDLLPANSIKLSNNINLPKNCLVFDINQGCSGFVQALCIISKLTEAYKEILLVTVDRYRSKLEVNDRSTNAVFSDGATASIIKKNSNLKIVYEDHYTDGSKRDLLYQSYEKNENQGKLHMSGAEIWMFTRINVVPQIQKAIDYCLKYKLNLKGIYMHQASKVVVQGIAKLLNVSDELIFETYQFFGNTVSSTIPFMFNKYPLKLNEKNSVYIMAGFGVGLTSTVLIYGNVNE